MIQVRRCIFSQLKCRSYQIKDTVEALVSDHLGNSERWSQLDLVAHENGALVSDHVPQGGRL